MKIFISFVSLMGLLLVVLPGPLYKYGIVDLGTAFAGFSLAMLAGGAALIMLLLQALFKRHTLSFRTTIITMLLASSSILIPLTMLHKAKSVPPIHDISTDLTNPPKFVAIIPLRADAPNPATYSGTESAAQQRVAYPDLSTLSYPQSKSTLLKACEQAASSLDWELVVIDADTGIVEATDTTPWFGFQDDVVIRITDAGSKRLVDIRSKSRIGGSDLGKNAERIRRFVKELDKVLES
ncbi:hypothetical protein CAP50_02740 [Psychrobacter sp. L7]|uniref:DUF1499 domain-containing protein n=1 Tax=Psychrobacter sp. L7 TaxID=1982756 RepID=UPI000C29FF52|nr:DUF1499 domain-containing protein [Psychrobacter sp. L7]PJX26703.1 hypothetical protein CAP50_02740 [Psychrobacter sp. L7]